MNALLRASFLLGTQFSFRGRTVKAIFLSSNTVTGLTKHLLYYYYPFLFPSVSFSILLDKILLKRDNSFPASICHNSNLINSLHSCSILIAFLVLKLNCFPYIILKPPNFG